MKTLTTGALFTDVLAYAAREGYPGTFSYAGVTYKSIKSGASYVFRQLTLPDNEVLKAEVQTTNATATVIAAVPVAEGEQVTVRALVSGLKAGADDGYGSMIIGVAQRAAAGNVELVGVPAGLGIVEDSGGTPAVTFTVNAVTQELELKVTGIAAETWNWQANPIEVQRSQT